MLVTTSYHPTTRQLQLAQRVAEKLNGSYTSRNRVSLDRLLSMHGQQEIVVSGSNGLRYIRQGQSEVFFFHPSLAQVRMKRMLRGEPDYLIDIVARVEPGYDILDCTAGLCSDAILFSFAVGDKGTVTALESEPVIAVLVQEGLKTYQSDLTALDTAMGRVRLICSDHLGYMKGLPDKSVDIVYFDPMFRQTIEQSRALDPLKDIANHHELRSCAIEEAIRIARKRVVIKEHRESEEFRRLGFNIITRPNSKIAYGVIEA